MQRDESNTATRDAIRALGRRGEIAVCDLADLSAVKTVFDRALELMGGEVHIMVNCGGIQRRAPAVDFPESDWDEVSPFGRTLAFFFGFGFVFHPAWVGFLPLALESEFRFRRGTPNFCFLVSVECILGQRTEAEIFLVPAHTL